MNRMMLDLLTARILTNRPIHLTVVSGSMAPLMRPGSNIRVGTPTKIRRGDILLMHLLPQLLVHRVMHIGKQHVITKGDSAGQKDRAIPHEAILGTVEAVKRGDHWVNLRSRRGRLLGELTAWLSLLHCQAGKISNRLLRGVAVRGVRLGMRAITCAILSL